MTRLAVSVIAGTIGYGFALRVLNDRQTERVLRAWGATLDRDLARSGFWS